MSYEVEVFLGNLEIENCCERWVVWFWQLEASRNRNSTNLDEIRETRKISDVPRELFPRNTRCKIYFKNCESCFRVSLFHCLMKIENKIRWVNSSSPPDKWISLMNQRTLYIRPRYVCTNTLQRANSWKLVWQHLKYYSFQGETKKKKKVAEEYPLKSP